MAPRTSLTLNAGDIVGDYEIVEPLGAGGMGAVFKVRHQISGRIEALKIILPQVAGESLTVDRFLREIRLLAGLQHANIGSLFNAFRVGDQFAMAMEFVDGVSLRHKLNERLITFAQALAYSAQILSALAYAHARGVIHRDIKPSNIMIQSDAQVKLLDFGLATSQYDAEITQPGSLLGSPHYMSPEQARGEKADARSDLYSTGTVLYEMAAGQPLFNLHGAYAIIAAHLSQAPRPLGEINPDVPAEFSRIVMKSLAKDPAQRFQTAREFLGALEAVSTVDDGSTLSLAPGRPLAPVSANTPSPAPCDDSSIGQSEIDQASKDLALYIGPIAHIIVKRAAGQSRTLRDLYQSLSGEISSDSQRREFLGKIPFKITNR